MASLLVGLTGGLASGKSTVARRLARAGFTVVDADQLVAELYEPSQPGATAVADLFGAAFLDSRGAVDRAALARKVFADTVARELLEAAIHPLVRARFRELADATPDIAVLEGAKLVEAGFAPDFDLVVTVEAPEGLRLARAVARGLPPADAHARLAAQADEAARRREAERVIENAGSLPELERQIEALISELRQRAGRAGN